MNIIDNDDLNQNQKQAVLWGEGPMLVLAGPGSGKTQVLTARVVRLLENEDKSAVLALTFTNKAAAEMRQRVNLLLGSKASRAYLSTFHSFAADLLQQHGIHLGIRPDFNLITQDEDRIAILKPIILTLRNQGHMVPLDGKTLLPLVDRLMAELFDQDSKNQSIPYQAEWVPLLYHHYLDAMVNSNRLDFGSLLYFSCRLLKEKFGVARVLRLTWPFVCVDEFQDSNKAQYELLKLIVGTEKPNLFVVADDDQIIYQWNGASPERLHDLKRDYNMTVVQLPENYRCPPQIINYANKLIEHNFNRTPGKQRLVAHKLASSSSNSEVVRYLTYSTLQSEAQGVAKDIRKRGLNPGKCVVLARAASLLLPISNALNSLGIESYLVQRKDDFSSSSIQVLLLSLRLAISRHERDILRRLCVAWGELTGVNVEMEDVVAAATLKGGDFLKAWEEAAAMNEGKKVTTSLLSRITESLVERLDYQNIVDWFLSNGWKEWKIPESQELDIEVETWKELHYEIISEYNATDLSLSTYLQQMDMRSKAPHPSTSAVRCMTVHGSKGLEFDHVYLIGMAQGIFPSYQATKKGEQSREMEEERRNCFVAITRVAETLTLSRAEIYHGWGKEPSQFLAEMGFE